MANPHSSFRLPPKAKARLSAMAKSEEATMAALLTRLINEAFKERGLPEPSPPAPAPKRRRPH